MLKNVKFNIGANFNLNFGIDYTIPMNKRTIWIIIGLMAVSLVGLAWFQLYWINNAIKLSNERFKRDVYESLNRVALRLERSELGTVAFNQFGMKDTIVTVSYSGTATDDTLLTVVSQHNIGNTDSLPANRKLWVTNAISEEEVEVNFDDTLQSYSVEIVASGDSQQLSINLNKVLHKTRAFKNVVQHIVMRESEDITQRVNPNQIDSLLKLELQNRGINIYFEFGVLDAGKQEFIFIDTTEVTEQALLSSPLKASLFPNDILQNASVLVVSFPTKDRFLLRKIWATLASSVFLLLVIIGCFTYAIYIILKQKKLSDLKNDFINNMTHEFKTPIATVALAAEVLSDNHVDLNRVGRHKYVGVIKEEAQRLEHQVERVLQAATMDKEELEVVLTRQDIHPILHDVVERAKLPVSAAGGSISLTLKATHTNLLLDAYHIQNALGNLIDNAIKYTKKEPIIHIKTQSNNKRLLLSIADNGMGIHSEAQKHIFDKFYRVPTGNVHNVKGFGLGLSYVKYIVEAHNGHITVHSAPDEGTTFHIELPLTYAK